jgi:membrane-associated phospholipid phosphatase
MNSTPHTGEVPSSGSRGRLLALLDLDQRWSAKLRVAEKPGTARTFAIILAHSGDSWFWGAGLALIWWLGPNAWKWRAAIMVIAIAVTAVCVMVIKVAVRRRRPAGEWGTIYRSTDPHSFPSGHAARMMMLWAVSLHVGPPWLAVALAAWAPLVALARVAMGVHYLSDVLGGGLLGLIIGALSALLF